VAVDFSRWGTPAYYQNGARLVVAANEILGDAARFFSVDLVATGDAKVTTGTYDCSKSAADGAPIAGVITYGEESMARVWKSAPGLPCTVTVTGIGAVGGRLEGTFSATLAASKGGAAPVVISDGLFAVERGAYGADTQ
jgi:hypothetical protein